MRLAPFVLAASLHCVACASLSTAESAPPLSGRNYTALGAGNGERCRTLLMVVAPASSFEDAIDQAVAKTAAEQGGETMVDVTFTHVYTYYLLFSRECVRYEGTVVRLR